MPYVITSKTYALISLPKGTRIIEQDRVLVVKENMLDLISYNCYITGSSLTGRQEGSSYLTGTSYKPPIVINEKSNLIFLPTHSIRNPNCCWFNLNSILSYYPKSNKTVLLEFKNNQKIVINISYYIFDKQVMRASRLLSILKGQNI